MKAKTEANVQLRQVPPRDERDPSQTINSVDSVANLALMRRSHEVFLMSIQQSMSCCILIKSSPCWRED
jgi:hypothetical protein